MKIYKDIDHMEMRRHKPTSEADTAYGNFEVSLQLLNVPLEDHSRAERLTVTDWSLQRIITTENKLRFGLITTIRQAGTLQLEGLLELDRNKCLGNMSQQTFRCTEL
jgi:hypothetical protein